MALAFRLVVTGCIGALLLACSGDSGEPETPTGRTTTAPATATATPTSTATATPVTLENAEGPLFYYVAGPPHEPELRAVDMATGVEVLGQPLGRFTDAKMRGERLLIRTEGDGRSALLELALDGSTVRILHEGAFGLSAFGISPDGTKLVVVEHHMRALILDWDTLDVIAELRQEQLPPEVGDGILSWAQWVEDSEHVVLDIGVERDGCGPGHAVFGLDGEFQFFPNRGCNHTSPDGRLMADPGGYGCFLIGDDLVQVLDSVSGEEVARYSEPRTVLTPWSWSPDSAEVLVRRSYVPARFDPRDPAEDCAFMESEEFRDSYGWLTIDAATGAATPVEDIEALFDRWFPERRVTLSCGTPFEQVLWSRFGHTQARCDSDAGMGTVSVDGVAVGEATEIEVLRFVER